MTIIPAALAGNNRELAAALRRGAQTPGEQAAVGLLLAIPHTLYTRKDLTEAYVLHHADEQAPAAITVLWHRIGWLATTAPLSSGERTALYIAADMVSLGEDLLLLDAPLRAAARVALARMAGVPVTGDRPGSDRPEGDGSESVPDGVDGMPVGRRAGWTPVDDDTLRADVHGLLGDLGRRARATREQPQGGGQR